MGIEPTSSAWKAEVLAVELHPRIFFFFRQKHPIFSDLLAQIHGGGGRIIPGILPSTPSGPSQQKASTFKFAPGEFVKPTIRLRRIT